MLYYISKNNQQQGPFDENKIRLLIADGHLTKTDIALRQGDSEWRYIETLFPQDFTNSADFESQFLAFATQLADQNALAAPTPTPQFPKLSIDIGGSTLLSKITWGIIWLIVPLGFFMWGIYRFANGEPRAIESFYFGLFFFFVFSIIAIPLILLRSSFFRGMDAEGVTNRRGTKRLWTDLQYVDYITTGSGMDLNSIKLVFRDGKVVVPPGIARIPKVQMAIRSIKCPAKLNGYDGARDLERLRELGVTQGN